MNTEELLFIAAVESVLQTATWEELYNYREYLKDVYEVDMLGAVVPTNVSKLYRRLSDRLKELNT